MKSNKKKISKIDKQLQLSCIH